MRERLATERNSVSTARAHEHSDCSKSPVTMNTNITERMYQERAKTKEKSETEELAELMSLGINHPARKRHREREMRRQNEQKERQWNATPFRTRMRFLKERMPSRITEPSDGGEGVRSQVHGPRT